ARVDFDSRQPAPPMREPAGEPAKFPAPKRIDHGAMPDERVQAGVAGEDFERGARRRIALKHDSNVFTEAVKHAAIFAFPIETLKYSRLGLTAGPPRGPWRLISCRGVLREVQRH